MTADYERAADQIRERCAGVVPALVLQLGSGLGAATAALELDWEIPYGQLPGFPLTTVSGHAGCLRAGRLYGVPLLCLQGRAHYYEGHTPATLANPIRALRLAGCEQLLITSAAGCLNPSLGPGHWLLVADHINWAGVNPLQGANDDRLGPRFPPLDHAYDAALRRSLQAAATAIDLPLSEGVYLMTSGPNFETPAEIRAFARLGADAVGMSLIPECVVANHCGMRVAALAGLTNWAAGLSTTALSHAETLAGSQALATSLEQLLRVWLTFPGSDEEQHP